LNFVELEG